MLTDKQRDQIEALRRDAGAHQDWHMVAICERALDPDAAVALIWDLSQEEALAKCEHVIAAAKAAEEDR